MSIVLGLSAVICGTYFATKLHTVNIEFRTRLDEEETRLPAGILDKVKDSKLKRELKSQFKDYDRLEETCEDLAKEY